MTGSPGERGFAELVHLIWIGVVLLYQHPYDFLMLIPGSEPEQCAIPLIRLLG